MSILDQVAPIPFRNSRQDMDLDLSQIGQKLLITKESSGTVVNLDEGVTSMDHGEDCGGSTSTQKTAN